MKNALLLGSTEMLGGLVAKLLADHFAVFVVGRNRARLAGLERINQGYGSHLTTMVLDYGDVERLGRWVAHTQLLYGSLDLVVAWIHGGTQSIFRVVGHEIEQYRHMPWDLYQVLGLDASRNPPAPPPDLAYCRYHRVYLGYARENSTTRWLTHAEIVDGVHAALSATHDHEIGLLRPYSDRPD